ncbi:hypothetical protein LTR08_005250 [Meristemomyces frigidus]|nr:hypothetical protein LTR08_005250 [Meristemomyces frigidus]
MDKASPEPGAGAWESPRPHSKRPVLKVAAVLALCAGYTLLQTSGPTSWASFRAAPIATDVTPTKDFAWADLETKPYLAYTPCYERFQCAKLELPMDYFNGSTNATISLAVIRQPAVVPVTDPQYGGAVLLNPGGPGGSGVSFIFRGGKHVRETIDAADGLKFDLISFDPRAVGQTTPSVECVRNAQLDHAWQVRLMEEGVFEASDAALGRLWSMSIARGASCALEREDGGADMRRFVTTASVARDMLEVVEKHGAWREAEAKRLLNPVHVKSCSGKALTQKVKPVVEDNKVPSALLYKPGQERLQYWGFSYGTYLGNTFAAMFPDRVHRIVVDGVVDAYNYKQALWSDNLIDTEKDMNQFYFHCARAGYPACALANKAGQTTAQGVSDRVANISRALFHNPLPVIGPNPEVITYSDVKGLIFAGLYAPIQAFPYMANLLVQVEQGNGTEFAKLLKAYHGYSCPAPPLASSSNAVLIPLRNVSNSDVKLGVDGTMVIACTDGDDQSAVNRTAFAAFAKELAAISPSIGSMWSTVRMNCIHYTVRPLYRFEGPWEATTSHPLLMIGNTADPVTPVKFAHKMAKGFAGAVALTQDSAGHCSSSTFSACTTGFVRGYFQTGGLPPVGTVCGVDEMPFGPGPGSEGASVEMVAMRARQAGIGGAMFGAGGGFMKGGLGGRAREGWWE